MRDHLYAAAVFGAAAAAAVAPVAVIAGCVTAIEPDSGLGGAGTVFGGTLLVGLAFVLAAAVVGGSTSSVFFGPDKSWWRGLGAGAVVTTLTSGSVAVAIQFQKLVSGEIGLMDAMKDVAFWVLLVHWPIVIAALPFGMTAGYVLWDRAQRRAKLG